jgi:hypothetical protein
MTLLEQEMQHTKERLERYFQEWQASGYANLTAYVQMQLARERWGKLCNRRMQQENRR